MVQFLVPVLPGYLLNFPQLQVDFPLFPRHVRAIGFYQS